MKTDQNFNLLPFNSYNQYKECLAAVTCCMSDYIIYMTLCIVFVWTIHRRWVIYITHWTLTNHKDTPCRFCKLQGQTYLFIPTLLFLLLGCGYSYCTMATRSIATIRIWFTERHLTSPQSLCAWCIKKLSWILQCLIMVTRISTDKCLFILLSTTMPSSHVVTYETNNCMCFIIVCLPDYHHINQLVPISGRGNCWSDWPLADWVWSER